MNCRKVSNLLSAYIDCELPGVEQLQVQRHLRGCAACEEEHEALLATKRMLSGLSMKPPCTRMEDRILDAVANQQGTSARVFGMRVWWSVLTERQRRRVRLTALCGAFCSLSVVLAAGRIAGYVEGAGELGGPTLVPASQALVTPYMGAASVSPAPPRAPGRDFVLAHDSWSDAQPVHPGVTVAPLPMEVVPGGPGDGLAAPVRP